MVTQQENIDKYFFDASWANLLIINMNIPYHTWIRNKFNSWAINLKRDKGQASLSFACEIIYIQLSGSPSYWTPI